MSSNLETKRRSINWDKVELYHNFDSASQNFQINTSGAMPGVGVGQQQRIGDRIQTSGCRLIKTSQILSFLQFQVRRRHEITPFPGPTTYLPLSR